ncbi:hypothetical protein F5B21DRAFT_33832 [Xylaria acuta]|nr:hypothetical protein F5B21DRAFT_33832 [Xylaria acuta]
MGGLVFQERASAVHTIHFYETEAYWERGSMIWRESPTLGDSLVAPNRLGSSYFPELTPHDNVSAQDVFLQYSRFDLTESIDRPPAILGLEYRLAIHLRTPLTYGVQANNAAQSPLWKRSSDVPMRKIRPRVPSWSWMSRTGPIMYVQLKECTPGRFQRKYETISLRDHHAVVYQMAGPRIIAN